MKGLVSVETLAQMPLPFVHCLRDIRIQQLEAKRRQQEIMAAQRAPNFANNANRYQAPANPAEGIDESAIEELVDELT